MSAATDWEPHFRYWVGQKADIGWTCRCKINWRWLARLIAWHHSRHGYRMKVEDKGRRP